jgi:hypothetical protein
MSAESERRIDRLPTTPEREHYDNLIGLLSRFERTQSVLKQEFRNLEEDELPEILSADCRRSIAEKWETVLVGINTSLSSTEEIMALISSGIDELVPLVIQQIPLNHAVEAAIKETIAESYQKQEHFPD